MAKLQKVWYLGRMTYHIFLWKLIILTQDMLMSNRSEIQRPLLREVLLKTSLNETSNLEEAKQRLKHLKVNSSLGTTVQADVIDTRVEPQASRFAGRSIHDLLVVEVFAGSARLTKACKGLVCEL